MVDLSFLVPYGYSTKVVTSGGATIYEIPFLDRMSIVFIVCVLGMYIISMIQNSKGTKVNALEVDTKMFKVTPGFAVGALIICGIVAALYTMFW